MVHPSGAIAAAAAFVAALLLTPLVRALARRMGAIVKPKDDRWHQRPTATLGGIAIAIPVITATLLLFPHRRDLAFVVGGSTLVFAIGLVDDFFHIRPYQKLIGQIIAAACVMQSGLVLPWTSSPALNLIITLVWLVGITNAVNMLDNMDGLSAGVAAIAAGFLSYTFATNHLPAEATILATFSATLLGFLVYNYNPASIFMGDCGSLFAGFFLASSALVSGQGGGRSRSIVAVLAVPVLVLGVPIFDTTFVTLMRKLAGRAASRGGRDHTSHRLVALGLSEKNAVWMLYALALTAGTIAIAVRRMSLDLSLMAIGTFTIVLTFLGIHLGHVRVYDDEELAVAREKPLVAFLFELSHKRRVFEVALDSFLIVASYYLAYACRFGPFSASSSDWLLFRVTLPVVVCVKAATFLLLGMYRGMWRYVSLPDVFRLSRAVLASSIAVVLAIVFALRFDGFSRTVYALDACFMLLFVLTSRFAFRLLGNLLPGVPTDATRRVLIYGAGGGGELLAREVANNTSLHYTAIAFADDDADKGGRSLHGLHIYRPTAAQPLPALLQRLRIDEVLLSTMKIDGDRIAAIAADCAAASVGLTRACITFQPLSAGTLGWAIASSGSGSLIARSDVGFVGVAGRSTPTEH